MRFDRVGFDYGDDQPVLTDVTLSIGAGRSVGIVGRTGSGKTTFSRLVLRLVDASAGAIELGGVPIDQIPLAELRHRVAMVPQEVELFGGSIRDNVTLFDPSPTDAHVIAALRAVGLDALADGGIDRALGSGGAGLSAGEAQLLAMARVWLRNADLVVLDEATARIDPVTEARLESAVHKLMAGRTTLIIAHRLSTFREVDDIVVFDDGRIVESGERDRLAGDPTSRFHRLLVAGARGRRPGHRRRAGVAAMNVWKLSWKVSQHESKAFWLGWVLFILFFIIPVGIGWALSRGFGALADGDSGAVTRWVDRVGRDGDGSDGFDPLGRLGVDPGVHAHADVPARQPARRPGGERRARSRSAGRFCR